MRIAIIDTECTGYEGSEVIELAAITIDNDSLDGPVEFERRYKPSGPINYGAMATHGITMDDLKDCPPSEQAKKDVPSADYLLGHNVEFDWKMIGEPITKCICTYHLSKWLWPDADSHKLTALVIQYIGVNDKTMGLVRDAHGALVDVELCLMLFDRIKVELQTRGMPVDVESIWALSEKAKIPEVMPFGKHKGEKIADVPAGYRKWLLNQPDVDKYLRIALEK
jgi:exodeoxyribonuclease X